MLNLKYKEKLKINDEYSPFILYGQNKTKKQLPH